MENEVSKNLQTQKSITLENKLSFMTKLSYGVGDFASNLSWAMVSSFLMIFYTDTFGIAPVVVATMFLVVRVVDAFYDPMIGLVAERTKSKYGRFRPYLLYVPIFFAMINILTFTVPPFSITGKIVYAYITYLLLGMLYSAVNVPYGALATVMTQDMNERTSLNSFRMFFTNVASIVIGMITMPLILKIGNGNKQIGYFWTTVLYSVVAVLLFWTVFKNCKEVIELPRHKKLTLKDSFLAVAKNSQLISLIIYALLQLTSLFGRIGLVAYYAIYDMKNPNMISVLMGVYGVFSAISVMFTPYIAKKLGKKGTAIAASLVGSIGLFIIYFSPYNNIPMILLGTIVSGIGGFGAPMIFSMVADTVDYAEWKIGARAEGAIYSTTSLSTKIASALGGSIGAAGLAFFGYVPNATQTELAMKGINIVTNLAPAILTLLAIIPMLFYKIDSELFQKMRSELEIRRNANIEIEQKNI